MNKLRNFCLVVLVLVASGSLFANYQQIDVRVGRTQEERISQSMGEVGYAIGSALEAQAKTANITKTKGAALASWVGGKKKICQDCYDSNLDLKQRVEMTALLALQFQDTGYSLQDSVETAKTAVTVELGNCQIPRCQ